MKQDYSDDYILGQVAMLAEMERWCRECPDINWPTRNRGYHKASALKNHIARWLTINLAATPEEMKRLRERSAELAKE